MLEDRFPADLVPSWENRDLRQLLCTDTEWCRRAPRIMNQLEAVALNEGFAARRGCGGKLGGNNWKRSGYPLATSAGATCWSAGPAETRRSRR